MRRGLLVSVFLAAAIALPAAALAAPHGASARLAAQAHAAKHHKHKKKHHHHPTTTGGGGPSMTVVGFGMNHLYVPDGTTVSSAADCSTMVQGNGYPIGPPQDVYVEVYVKAKDVPGSSPTQIGEDIPEEAAPRIASAALPLTPAVPFSQAFGASTLGFGTPPGSQTDIFRGNLFGTNDMNGPAASDFDGTYSFEASVDVNGTTLDSTATVTISC